MSVPGTGWGYDKDVAESLHDISETLDGILTLLLDKEERSREAQSKLEPAEDVGMMLLAGSLIEATLNDPKLDTIKKHTRLRELSAELLHKAKVLDKAREIGRRGEAEQVQKVVEKDTT